MADKALIDQLKSQIASIEAGGEGPPGASRSTRKEGDLAGDRDSASIPARRGNLVPREDGPSSSSAASGAARKSGGKRREVDFASAEDALSKIVALVNVSDRSERSVRERLARAEFSAAAIDEAIDRAKSYGFIDDMRFAEVLVRSRVNQGRGSAGIERELASNGIDPSTVEGWPEEFGVTPDSDLDRALELLDRKPPRSKNLREGAYRKLVQKGYPSSVASAAARTWSDNLMQR